MLLLVGFDVFYLFIFFSTADVFAEQRGTYALQLAALTDGANNRPDSSIQEPPFIRLTHISFSQIQRGSSCGLGVIKWSNSALKASQSEEAASGLSRTQQGQKRHFQK